MTNKYIASGAFGFELKIPAVTQNSLDLYFGWIPELHNKKIKYIDFFYAEDANGLSGRSLYNGTGAYITLSDYQNVQFVDAAPIIDVFDVNYTHGRRIELDKKIDLIKSKVTVTDADFAEERSMYFVFWYDEPEAMNAITDYYPDSSRDTEAVELRVLPAQRRAYFPDNRILVDRSITNIFSFWSLSYGTYKSPTGIPAIPVESFNSAYLTLAKGNFLFLKQVPLSSLSIAERSYIIELENVAFDAPNSYVEFATPEAVDTISSLLFNVEMESF
jgi:hypothetical protein